MSTEALEMLVVFQWVTIVVAVYLLQKQQTETKFFKDILHGLMNGYLKIVHTKNKVGIVPTEFDITEGDDK